jgi:methionyl aminopeptidase
MAIALRKPEEIEKLRAANRIVAQTLNYLKSYVQPGMTLAHIDQVAEEFIVEKGARPSFKGLYGFTGSVCTSVNDVIIHGVPTEYKIKEGDILGLDIGTELDGWYGDAAITIPIGAISKEDEELIDCAKSTLDYAISIIKPGLRFKELSHKIEQYILGKGYIPLRSYCGHGIGRKPHEEPEIPNYLDAPNPKQGPKIRNGMVFCLEPMICQKDGDAVVKEDGWSVTGADGLKGSHYEHTVAIIDNRAVILSQDIEP